ncbi:MAG: flagellar hook assembly protein FlgD [Methylicorpusculum sp.]|uniref:flagellar hook assembly protein FlgD n=1 Tax=Methylicorpusculum sp. TaxID=2713644 RepID=UPI0027189851|nr:flagellar hook assembly protein FlgD [Methylicorpusculum sp.]MDO8843822.1 flagellar hook assembly protein FlgD [Methylicorpusculum sp.]MDO8940227.1 flagellar hook assembly protein FlgD [Methylicorpusculum sp.]MDP2178196.1 flagellar hook assembly protein FlgD [Methylicorpusculum sp.]MDP2201096.1 flagellar hook assembly protein FlgD [Methylicorpusculum sp.]MDP3530511.1 flagellar hook assembly protein FlgD [Methylicorpusculum sp.]
MAIGLDTFKELGLATFEKAAVKKQELGQEAFLKIMTTQLQSQNPLKPMENADFMGQMAQFSTVSGIQDLQKSFKDFASSLSSDQALQAAGLVGRNVVAPVNYGLLAAGGDVSGEVNLPSSASNVTVRVTNASTGAPVKTLELGPQASGTLPFSWNGIGIDGTFANPGVYKVQVEASMGGQNVSLQPYMKSRVESVVMGNGQRGLEVNLAGTGPVSFSRLTKII